MKHLHKKFTNEQLRVFFLAYLKGRMTREEVEKELGIGKTRFFALLKRFKSEGENFSIDYSRHTPSRVSERAEELIKEGLFFDKGLIESPNIPLTSYNYSALADRLRNQGMKVSVPTIINRAKKLGCHLERRRSKRVHDREVLTTAIGALIQHDSSLHQWSPYAQEKWYLTTSLDDFSRGLLDADFVLKETTWAHISAAQRLMMKFGFPLRYYVDQLRIFRFVQGRDSLYKKYILGTDDVDPQWRQVVREAGVDVTYALSPQAKGKIERPYRWLQDRIVRTCALEKISTITDARKVLAEEVRRYNNHQVHSTTKEIPRVRFEKAAAEGNSFFRPFSIPKPYLSTKDLFCLREKRSVNAYHKISLWNKEINVPKVPLREEVDIHLIPNPRQKTMELRFWWSNQLVHTVIFPLKDFPSVHF